MAREKVIRRGGEIRKKDICLFFFFFLARVHLLCVPCQGVSAGTPVEVHKDMSLWKNYALLYPRVAALKSLLKILLLFPLVSFVGTNSDGKVF